ncbi:MAG: insulinase family protein [Myxococcota bacterium]|jgi:predicted Zn-dependent peptidase|nr:insulinase family protein [Myxococcota bacterium]
MTKIHFPHADQREPYFEQLELDNGLICLLAPLPHLRRASATISLRCGSRFETPQTNGLSHFLEHMVFRGCRHYATPFDINLRAESLGGYISASTSADMTEFELSLPAENLCPGLELLCDMLTTPRLEDLEIERRVVLEESQEDLDQKGRSIDIDLLTRSRLWPGHGLGHSVIGPSENIRGFDTRALREHHAASYGASRAVVCVAGAFEMEAMADFLRSQLADWEVGSPIAPLVAPQQAPGPTYGHAHRAGSQTSLRVAFHGLGERDPDYLAFVLLLRVLDDGMSTRLHRRIFDELGLCYNVAADTESSADAGAFYVDALTSHDNAEELVARLLELLAQLSAAPIAHKELEKAKHRARWALEAMLDDARSLATWFTEQALYLTARCPMARADEYDALTEEDLLRTARRVFRPQALHATTVGVLSARQRKAIERRLRAF